MTRQASIIEWLYAAISRGEREAVWACLAENVLWETATPSASLRWLTVAHGRDAVVDALITLPQTTLEIVPASFLDTGTVVAATVRLRATMPARSAGDAEWSSAWEEVHHWSFDGTGLICRLRQRGDVFATLLEPGGGPLFPFPSPER